MLRRSLKALALALLVAACAGAQDPLNRPPVVSAGPDQTVSAPASTVRLAGEARDPDGDTLELAWSQTDGPGAAVFSDPADATTTVSLSAVGDYTLNFAATDGRESVGDDVLLSVTDVQNEGVGSWEELPGPAEARQEVSYVQLGGLFYLVGGSTANEVYDPVARTWTQLEPLPADLDHIQGVALGGVIYYLGGCKGGRLSQASSTVYSYDPASDTFSEGAPMPRPRCAGGVAVYQDKIYYAGGLSGGDAQTWFDIYDPAANTWAELPDLPRPRDHAHATVLHGALYSIGGRDAAINATNNAIDVFDFAAQSWTTLRATLPTERGGFASAVVGDEILIIGGEGGGNSYAEVETFRPDTETWRTLAPMPTPRHGIQAAICNGGVYIAAGGIRQGVGPSAFHEVFYPAEKTACTPP